MAENDGMEELAALQAAEEHSANGRIDNLTPSQAQLLMARLMNTGGAFFDVPREFLTSSTRPEEFLPRSRLNESEIALVTRESARMNWAQAGWMDAEHNLWIFCTGRVALESEGRREALEAFTAMQRRRMEDQRSMLERLTQQRGENTGQGQNHG